MNLTEFESYFSPIDMDKIANIDTKEIEQLYTSKLNNEIKTLIHLEETHVKLEDGDFLRILSKDEIVNAQTELQVDFIALRSIPLIDTGDNNFLVYNIHKSQYQLFYIVEEYDFETFDTFSSFIDSLHAS